MHLFNFDLLSHFLYDVTNLALGAFFLDFIPSV